MHLWSVCVCSLDTLNPADVDNRARFQYFPYFIEKCVGKIIIRLIDNGNNNSPTPQNSFSRVVSVYDPAFTLLTGQTVVCDSVSYDSGFVWCSRSVWRFGGLGGKRGHQSAALLPPPPPRPSESLAQEHRKLWKCLSAAGEGHVCLLSDWMRTVTRWRDMKTSFSSVLSVVGDKDGGLSL